MLLSQLINLLHKNELDKCIDLLYHNINKIQVIIEEYILLNKQFKSIVLVPSSTPLRSYKNSKNIKSKHDEFKLIHAILNEVLNENTLFIVNNKQNMKLFLRN